MNAPKMGDSHRGCEGSPAFYFFDLYHTEDAPWSRELFLAGGGSHYEDCPGLGPFGKGISYGTGSRRPVPRKVL